MPEKLQEPLDKRIAASTWARPALHVALFLVCYVSYRGILDNGLFNDDFSWLRAARYDMTLHNALRFQVVEFFRPLINLSFYVMEKLRPGNIPVHHAFNLVLHFLCTVLVFRLVSNVTRNTAIAAASAMLFAVTSVHAAAVFWISARTTLVSTFFLLASIVVLTTPSARAPVRIVLSAILYTLALASKEEAFAGVLLVALLYILTRRNRGMERMHPAALVTFVVVSIVYLALRQSFMGGFFRQNWGPGAHVARNIGGGFLYQLYPWPVFSLFYPPGTLIAEPSSPFVPEALSLPLAVILIWAGYEAKKSLEMNVAVGWTILALLPEAPFRYRFFSTDSISQSRYYYLSSAGSALVIVLLLSILWNARSRARRAATVAIFTILCAGYLMRVDRLERKWDDFTRMYREVVATMIEGSERFSGVTTLAVEGSPLAFPYLEDAIVLERPAWRVVEVTGGASEAAAYAPCLYVSCTGVIPKVVRIQKIDRGT